MNLPAGKTKRSLYDDLYSTLKNERDGDGGWKPHYIDIGDYLAPKRLRWNNQIDRNKGQKKNSKIINSHAPLAMRTARSGMMSGITSPARPWKRLTTPDPDLAEYGPVKEWLHIVDGRMDETFARSNFYNALPTLYTDLLAFATGAMSLEEDPRSVIHCKGYPLGSYVLATSERGAVDTFFREFTMTVRQIVAKYGDKDAGPNTRWANISSHVKRQWDAGNYFVVVPVVHAIMPNMEHDTGKLASKYKAFSSCYFETATRENAGDREKFLRESGFDLFPILAPRWDLAAPDDVYGWGSPGIESLGDNKSLQLLEKRKAQANEKAYNPPLVGPSSLKTVKVSSLPGDVTYEDTREGQKGLRPLFETKPDTAGLMIDIEAHQKRISRQFFEDLFLMLAQDARATPPTAEEIRAREGERLLMLGPVLERLNNELLRPAIDLTFAAMLKHGMIPEAPEEIQDMDLKVEYISILAQAQKMVSTAGLDRFHVTVGGLARLKPEVVDKVDLDQSVDVYGDMLGVPPKIIVPDDKVVEIRKARAKRQQQAEQAAMAEQTAGAAKAMSETDTEGKNALTDLLAMVQGANQ